ncbi:MAG: hypothetical protein ABIQ04_02865 [Candidatus Saccharimonadales bacterium]
MLKSISAKDEHGTLRTSLKRARTLLSTRSMKTVIINATSSSKSVEAHVTKVWHSTSSQEDMMEAIIGSAINTSHYIDRAFAEYIKIQNRSFRRQPAVNEVRFDKVHLLSGNVWHHGTLFDLYVKGAPEQVLHRSDLTENEREKAEAILHALAADGYTVVGVAHTTLFAPIKKIDELPNKTRFILSGFIAIKRERAKNAKHVITQTQVKNGNVILITGDHVQTAYHDAKNLGIISSIDQVYDSRHMNVINDNELRDAIESMRVFARTTSQTNKRIFDVLGTENITIIDM